MRTVPVRSCGLTKTDKYVLNVLASPWGAKAEGPPVPLRSRAPPDAAGD